MAGMKSILVREPGKLEDFQVRPIIFEGLGWLSLRCFTPNEKTGWQSYLSSFKTSEGIEYTGIHDEETGEFFGYLQKDEYHKIKSKEDIKGTKDPFKAIRYFKSTEGNDKDFVEVAEVGDFIYGSYKDEEQWCAHTIKWVYRGILLTPFQSPIKVFEDGKPNPWYDVSEGSKGDIDIVGSPHCFAPSKRAKSFYDLHSRRGLDDPIIEDRLLRKLATEIEQVEGLVRARLEEQSWLPSFSDNDEILWTSDPEDFQGWLDRSSYTEDDYGAYYEYVELTKEVTEDIISEIETASTDQDRIYRLAHLLSAYELQNGLTYEQKIDVVERLLEGKGVNGTWWKGFSDYFYAFPKGTIIPEIVGKETIFVKIIRAFKDEEATDFLVYLEGQSKYRDGQYLITRYEAIMQQMIDFFGVAGEDGGMRAFVNAILHLWKKSDYNPYDSQENFLSQKYDLQFGVLDPVNSPPIINYISTKKHGFFDDNYDFPFSATTKVNASEEAKVFRNRIVVYESVEKQIVDYTQTGMVGKSHGEKTTIKTPFFRGEYGIFQPVSLLVQLENDGQTVVKMPANGTLLVDGISQNNYQVVPLFFIKYVADENDTSNFWTGIGYFLDIATLFTGVGNLAKLRHLRHLSVLRKFFSGTSTVSDLSLVLKGFQGVAVIFDIASSSLSLYIAYFQNNCSPDNSTLCKILNGFLHAIELASFSMDIVSTIWLRRQARLLKVENDLNNNALGLSTSSIAELDSLADLTKLVDKFIDWLESTEVGLTTLATELKKLDDADQEMFVWLFGFANFDQKLLENMNNALDLVDMLNDWVSLVFFRPFGLSMEFLRIVRQVNSNSTHFHHLRYMINTSATGFQPKGGHHVDIFAASNPNKALLPGEFGCDTREVADVNGHKMYKPLYIKKPPGAQGGTIWNNDRYFKKTQHGVLNPSWSDARIREEQYYSIHKRVSYYSQVSPPAYGRSVDKVMTKYKSFFSDGTPVIIIHYNYQMFNGVVYDDYWASWQLDI